MKYPTKLQRKLQHAKAWCYENDTAIGITSAFGLYAWVWIAPLLVGR